MLRVKAASLPFFFIFFSMSATKPHKEYSSLVDILLSRNMIIEDPIYAARKLSQVGYYRLSGFWFTSRKIETIIHNGNQKTQFIDEFLPNTKFEDIYKLYLFDKKLRLLLLDIIERLEINIRSIIAHELGRIDPLAYEKEIFLNLASEKVRKSYYDIWLPKLEKEIKGNRSEFILYHRNQNKKIPFWVIIEIWDFGMLSKYYSFLKGSYKQKIAKKFNVDSNKFGKWLHEINILRNLCAHHSRIWNKDFNAIILPPNQDIEINEKTAQRVFGRILVLWYLVKQTESKNYKWLEKFSALVKQDFPTVPNAKLEFMGLKDHKQLSLIF
ncbi:Abi family protein [Avibacterium avium]|uniref:Abi family protein n=4 Tax=Avibacterium avium TaxID=751 RepID=UPI003BF846FD